MHSGGAIEIIFWLENGEAAAAAADCMRSHVASIHAMDTEKRWKTIPANGQYLIRIMPS